MDALAIQYTYAYCRLHISMIVCSNCSMRQTNVVEMKKKKRIQLTNSHHIDKYRLKIYIKKQQQKSMKLSVYTSLVYPKHEFSQEIPYCFLLALSLPISVNTVVIFSQSAFHFYFSPAPEFRSMFFFLVFNIFCISLYVSGCLSAFQHGRKKRG